MVEHELAVRAGESQGALYRHGKRRKLQLDTSRIDLV